MLLMRALVAFVGACADRVVDGAPPETPSASASGPATTGDATRTEDGYLWVIRRPHVTFALADTRGVSAASLALTFRGLAAQAESCIAQRIAEGAVRPREVGALRIVVALDARGNVSGTGVRISNDALAPTALVCFIARVRASTFSAVDSTEQSPTHRDPSQDARSGFAVEALWRAEPSAGAEKIEQQ
jgi:hypothetical protein